MYRIYLLPLSFACDSQMRVPHLPNPQNTDDTLLQVTVLYGVGLNVPERECEQLTKAESKGTDVNQRIKPKYPCRKAAA